MGRDMQQILTSASILSCSFCFQVNPRRLFWWSPDNSVCYLVQFSLGWVGGGSSLRWSGGVYWSSVMACIHWGCSRQHCEVQDTSLWATFFSLFSRPLSFVLRQPISSRCLRSSSVLLNAQIFFLPLSCPGTRVKSHSHFPHLSSLCTTLLMLLFSFMCSLVFILETFTEKLQCAQLGVRYEGI